MNPVILLIEDESHIRRFVRLALEEQEWKVIEAERLKEGLSAVATRRPDLIILDLGLPDGDGVHFIQDVRTWSTIPIIVLSARTDEQDKVAALDAGADDYLSKPFGIPELLARIRANFRRHRPSNTAEQALFEFGNVSVDLTLRHVHKNGVEIHLTPIEYRLLSVLISNTGRVLTHRQLLREVWGTSHSASPHYVRIYMGHLRQKLEDDPAQPRYLLTETAVGYRLMTGN
jgi:two-component system, OmpR family, KDP operon response regulator KdpE